jgi:hypothetical protein
MDLSGVVDSLGQKNVITVTRRAGGAYVNGRYAPGSESHATMDAVVFPAQPQELKRLPEGQRTEKVLAFVVEQELRAAAQDGHQADRIAYLDEVFEVEQVEDYSATGGYWHALAVRVS